MSKLKSHGKIVFSLVLLFLLVAQVGYALPDGSVGKENIYDKALVTGTLTKDIDPSAITYEQDFTLRNGELHTYNSNDGYGNITFGAENILNSQFNSSGYIRVAKYTEVDSGNALASSIDFVDSDGSKAKALNMFFNHASASTGSATLYYDLPTAIPTDRWVLIGLKIQSNTLNASGTTETFSIRLGDNYYASGAIGDDIGFEFQKAPTAEWAKVGTTDVFTLNDTSEKVVVFQKKISDWDLIDGVADVGSIKSIMFSFNRDGANLQGAISVSVFALEFLETKLKLGLDLNQERTATEDYTYYNTTTTISPEFKLRKIDPTVTNIIDAQLDVIKIFDETVTFDADALTVERRFDVLVSADDSGLNKFSFSSLTLYYILGVEGSKYSKFDLTGVDKTSLLSTEEASDAINLGSINVDSLYVVETLQKLTKAEFDLQLGLYETETNVFVWLMDRIYGILAFLGLGAIVVNAKRSAKAKTVSGKKVTRKK